MIKQSVSILLALLMVGVGCFGESSLEQLFAEDILVDLQTAGELSRTFWRDGTALYIPDLTAKNLIIGELESLKPTVAVEILRIYTKQGLAFDSPDVLLKIYNILLSISTMEGIEYYSASRGRMRTLFSESYCIDSPQERNRQPDPQVQLIPASKNVYSLQTDLTFGENIYLTELHHGDNYILMKSQNLTTMRYLFLPAVRPNRSVTFLILIPAGEQLIFYGLSGLRSYAFSGIQKKRAASLYNRNVAIYNWFVERLEIRL